MSAPLVPTSTPGIYKRGTKYAVRFKDPQGKTRQRAASTLKEARALRASLNADVSRGEYRELSRVTFAEYAPGWLEGYAGRTSRGIRAETKAEYKSELDRFAIPYFGRRRLVEIDPRDVKAYATYVLTADLDAGKKPRAPATVRQALAPVRALFATAVEEGLIRSNPAAGLRVSVATRSTDDNAEDEPEKAKALTEDELRLLLAKTDAAWRPFVEFVAATGMRISEAIAIRWSDVDFGAKRVNVRRRFRISAYSPPQSAYGRRAIPMTDRMSRDLWERRKQACNPTEGALVWPSTTGKPLDQANLTARVLKPAARRAGVPWAGWHTLRHTCGSILFRHGANAKQVQHWLGHHSPAFILAVYVHLLPHDGPDPAFLEDVLRRDQPPAPPVDSHAGEFPNGQLLPRRV